MAFNKTVGFVLCSTRYKCLCGTGTCRTRKVESWLGKFFDCWDLINMMSLVEA